MGFDKAVESGEMSPPILSLGAVCKAYGDTVALDDVSFEVVEGEFLTLLGPSGSGKSTLLRVISGLEEPDSAERMLLAGRSVIGVPPERRNVSTVFQHYALFPHMSVGQNVEYSLRVRKVPSGERRKAVEEALALVRLPGIYNRRTNQLSGGERQRVALARSLVMGPDILLLDEPLAALDEKLRLAMQEELIDLRRKTGRTFVLVTHSQEEAITMSDRIVLMRAGRIEQIATPQDIFKRPQTRFAADFIGIENIFDAHLVARLDDIVEVDVAGRSLRGSAMDSIADTPMQASVFFGIRAEHMSVKPCTEADGYADGIEGRLESVVYKGRFRDLKYKSDIGTLTVRVADSDAAPLDPAVLTYDETKAVVGIDNR